MQLGKPSKLAPREPCFAIFQGARFIRGGIFERIVEPVEIREYVNGKSKELVVCMVGRDTKYPIERFDGEWFVLELEDAP